MAKTRIRANYVSTSTTIWTSVQLMSDLESYFCFWNEEENKNCSVLLHLFCYMDLIESDLMVSWRRIAITRLKTCQIIFFNFNLKGFCFCQNIWKEKIQHIQSQHESSHKGLWHYLQGYRALRFVILWDTWYWNGETRQNWFKSWMYPAKMALY